MPATLTADVQSKTANIWFANELERRYGSQGIHATSVHPGTSAILMYVKPCAGVSPVREGACCCFLEACSLHIRCFGRCQML